MLQVLIRLSRLPGVPTRTGVPGVLRLPPTTRTALIHRKHTSSPFRIAPATNKVAKKSLHPSHSIYIPKSIQYVCDTKWKEAEENHIELKKIDEKKPAIDKTTFRFIGWHGGIYPGMKRLLEHPSDKKITLYCSPDDHVVDYYASPFRVAVYVHIDDLDEVKTSSIQDGFSPGIEKYLKGVRATFSEPEKCSREAWREQIRRVHDSYSRFYP